MIMSFPQTPSIQPSRTFGIPSLLISSTTIRLHRKRTRVYHSSQWNLSLVNLLVALISIALWISPASGTITVISQLTNESIVVFDDQPARFIPERVAFYGIQGYVVYSDPPNACTPVVGPPQDFFPINVNWILVARRFDCDFQQKIENAQNAGYSAIIVHNVGSNATEAMGADNPSKLVIYACFIGEYHGQLLRDVYSFVKSKEYFIRIQDDFSMNGYLLPFAIVVGVCFILMLIFMVRLVWQQVSRCIHERRRSRRRQLPSSALKKLPVSKWTKGDPYETCAICLEDFVEQDKVRVLPCSHGFHTVCIDPWLTKGRRVCPICKRKVILADERFPYTDPDTDDETTPLLRPTSSDPTATSSTSTFVQRENSIRRLQRRTRQVQHTNTNDTVSMTGSESSNDSNDPTTITSHHSLPVLAQVHNISLSSGQPSRFSSLQQPTSIAPGPGNNNEPDLTTHPEFYISCPEDSEEQMLGVTIGEELHESSAQSQNETSPEVPTVLIHTPQAESTSSHRSAIV